MDKKIKERISDLKHELACVESSLDDLVDILEGKNTDLYAIHDIEHFTLMLQLDGLWTPQLQTFLDNYMKFYNKTRD